MKLTTRALLAGAAALALVLAGCSQNVGQGMPGMGSGSSASPSDTSTTANGADVAFATMMIPHHEQAIEMADLVLAKSGIDERIATLATAIKAAQGPEIDDMTEWLTEWGYPYNSSGMEGMDHGGMMSGEDMSALEAATGAEANRLFLEQMIEHHEGAIDMAEVELDSGSNPDALALAQRIIDSQTAEIETMRDILASL